jgi:hypothetical protein
MLQCCYKNGGDYGSDKNGNGKGKDCASVEKFRRRDFVLARHEPFTGDSSLLQAD